MMDSREWAQLFGNPRFMPRLEVMRTQEVDLVPVRSRQEFGQEFGQESVRAEIDELRRSVAALGNVVSEICARMASNVPAEAGSPGASDVTDGTKRDDSPVVEAGGNDNRELELVPVDSVVYSIEDDKDKDKSKRGLFGRKTK